MIQINNAAILRSPRVFRDCSNDKRSNREIALLAVKLSNFNIRYIGSNLKDDREIIMVRQNNYNDKSF